MEISAIHPTKGSCDPSRMKAPSPLTMVGIMAIIDQLLFAIVLYLIPLVITYPFEVNRTPPGLCGGTPRTA